jgi:murein DD-endopeptidase MepM/ murein hydrolase activator NlpD
MRRHPPVFATSLLLSLAAFALSAQGAPVATAIVAPERLRQGDPLLTWVVAAPPAAEADQEAAVSSFAQPLEARLSSAEGKIVSRARCFDATGLLSSVYDGAEHPGARLFGALFSVPMDLKGGTYTLAVGDTEASILVEARDFALESIKLKDSNTKIRTETSKRKVEEAQRLIDLLSKVDAEAVFADGSPFLFPVEGGFQSASFGDRRRYLYSNGKSDTTVHAGLDQGVVVGTAVRACERGKVAMVADREVTGTTVVLEHLPGLYSLYFHLSSALVKQGQVVERGELIARSGMTGLATGPHLHWELRARGDAVDAKYWLGSALLDKEAIKATIVGLIEGR